MLWSLLGLFLMGLGFPKCWLTERKWPNTTPPEKKVHQPTRSWTHNCKDDFTDDVQWGDREWHLKFIGFRIIVLEVCLIISIILHFK
jgi:hypothetical protein